MAKAILKKPQAMIGLGIIVIMLIMAIFSPVLSPNDPNEINLFDNYEKPSATYPLGTDGLGRCVLSRLLYGARNSIFIAIPTLLLLATFSTVVATFCAYSGGVIDRVFSTICDILMAFPPLLVAVTLVGSFGQSYISIVLSIVISMWVWFAKIIRTFVLTEKNKGYVVACRVSGCKEVDIVIGHVLPNILPQLIVYFSTGVASIIITISGYAFLGLGFPAGTPEWGAMFSDAAGYLYSHPMLILWPGLCLLITTAGFNLFGEALRTIISHEED